MGERDYPTYEEIKDAQQQLAHNYSCNRDHCTQEERAVIEAAETWHEMRLMQAGTSRSLKQLMEAVDAMLAVRAKLDEKGAQQ